VDLTNLRLKIFFKDYILGLVWWLMIVIPATWKVEMGRSHVVQDQLEGEGRR
jgi:hypothetical protein